MTDFNKTQRLLAKSIMSLKIKDGGEAIISPQENGTLRITLENISMTDFKSIKDTLELVEAAAQFFAGEGKEEQS